MIIQPQSAYILYNTVLQSDEKNILFFYKYFLRQSTELCLVKFYKNTKPHTPELLTSALKCKLVSWDFSNMEYIPTACQRNGNSFVIFTLIMVFFHLCCWGISVGVCAISHRAELVHSSWAFPPLKSAERKIDASSPFKPLRGRANIPSKPFKMTRASSPLQKKQIISPALPYFPHFLLLLFQN